MKSHLAYLKINLALTFRDRTVLFFNYLFPLIFFFMFGQMSGASKGTAALQVVSMVLVIGIIGTGLFGAGLRAAMDREQNILRRFKVAPITASPILTAGLIAGLVTYLPVLFGIMALAHFLYKMPWPAQSFSIVVFVMAGVLAFRGIGAIVSAVVNSMAETQILTQLLYFPMLFLSGATIPIDAMPDWLQSVAQFIPSAHLFLGLQNMLVRNQGLSENLAPLGSLLLAAAVGYFVAFKLFRWEKEEKISGRAKLWILAVLAPFMVLGVWNYQTKANEKEAKIIARLMRRGRTRLITHVRIFVGDGTVIESGGVLIRQGRIAEIYSAEAPEAKDVDADEVEGAGRTLLPGLIDTHVHFGAPGGFLDPATAKPEDFDWNRALTRAAAAYLYSGVTTVRSLGDSLEAVSRASNEIAAGAKQGAEVLFAGPMFTAEGGHGTEYLAGLPPAMKANGLEQLLRLPKSSSDAQRQVQELQPLGVHAIKAILEAGTPTHPFPRLDSGVYQGIAAAARERNIPLATHTHTAPDVADAVAAGSRSIEHGMPDADLPAELLDGMKQAGVVYTPTLAVLDTLQSLREGRTVMFERSLVEQVAPPGLLASSKSFMASPRSAEVMKPLAEYGLHFDTAKRNALRAFQAGVPVATGTDSGNPGLVHGPAIHREMQLLVEAGLPPAAALQAATRNAARAVGIEDRAGVIRKGAEASLVLVEGNPLVEIGATERIRAVFFKGEMVDRTELLVADKKAKGKR